MYSVSSLLTYVSSDQQQPIVRRMQELDAGIRQNRVVLDRDPQLGAVPLGNRRVGEVLEREHVVVVHREGRLQRLPGRQRRADVVAGVADRMKSIDNVGPVVDRKSVV